MVWDRMVRLDSLQSSLQVADFPGDSRQQRGYSSVEGMLEATPGNTIRRRRSDLKRTSRGMVET
jgi:hypothetical protein